MTHWRSVRNRALTLFLLLACLTPAFSQVSISPLVLEENVYPGGFKSVTFVITNTGKVPLSCTARISSMIVTAGGLPLSVDKAPRSCASWFTLRPDSFSLNAGQSRRVVGQVRAPREVAGGYYAMVIAKGVPPRKAPDSSGGGVGAEIRFSYQVSSVVMLRVPGPNVRADIQAAPPEISNASNGGFTLSLPVRNVGNIHARLTGVVGIRSEAGQTVESFQLSAGRGFLLPESERLFKSNGKTNLPDGTYRADIRLTVVGSSRHMDHSFPFYVRHGKPTVATLSEAEQTALRKESSGFTVSPAMLDYTIPAGAQRTQAVEITNLTRDPLTVSARVLEWERDDVASDRVVDHGGPGHHSGSKLVAPRMDQLQLPPLGHIRVPVVAGMPPNVQGEYYAAVVFDRVGATLDESPSARARRSALVTIRAPDGGVVMAELTNLSVKRTPAGTYEITAEYRDTGNIGMNPEVEFAVLTSKNRTVDHKRPKPQPAFVQAGALGKSTITWTEVLPPGNYVAQVSMRADPDKPPIILRKPFSVPK